MHIFKKTGIAVLLLLGLSRLLSRPAGAHPFVGANTDTPIRIDRCAAIGRSVLEDPLNGTRIEIVSGIAFRFVNVRRVGATRVNVTIRYEGSTQSIVNSGTFAPGVAINRDVDSFAGSLYGSEVAKCTVTSVVYADGTAWNARP